MNLFDAISKICKHTEKNAKMSSYTTFRIGGAADVLCKPEKIEEIKDILKIAKENNIKPFIIGNGSNLLVSDKGMKGIVIKIGENMSKITIDGERVYAQAGALLSKIAYECTKNSLTGVENISGIPASFGGAIYMNAGAYGTEISDVLESVVAISPDGEIVTLNKEEMNFGYRESIFIQNDGYVILSGVLKLKKGVREEIEEAVKDVTKRRVEKQPLNLPSAGSVFKRPVGHFAGKLIEDAGLKGYSIGGARISEKHAGFIVNDNNATAEDVLSLIDYAQKTVFEKFGVEIEPEIRLVGEK